MHFSTIPRLVEKVRYAAQNSARIILKHFIPAPVFPRNQLVLVSWVEQDKPIDDWAWPLKYIYGQFIHISTWVIADTMLCILFPILNNVPGIDDNSVLITCYVCEWFIFIYLLKAYSWYWISPNRIDIPWFCWSFACIFWDSCSSLETILLEITNGKT